MEFDQFVGRDFCDRRFFAVHRLFVDAYALQHPRGFCASPKSLAAHLAGMAAILEAGASPASGPAELQRWLNGTIAIEKPILPSTTGAMTIAHLPTDATPKEWTDAVRDWAREVWSAYADLHATAHAWLAEALD